LKRRVVDERQIVGGIPHLGSPKYMTHSGPHRGGGEISRGGKKETCNLGEPDHPGERKLGLGDFHYFP